MLLTLVIPGRYIILQICRLGDHLYRAHGTSASLSSSNSPPPFHDPLTFTYSPEQSLVARGGGKSWRKKFKSSNSVIIFAAVNKLWDWIDSRIRWAPSKLVASLISPIGKDRPPPRPLSLCCIWEHNSLPPLPK